MSDVTDPLSRFLQDVQTSFESFKAWFEALGRDIAELLEQVGTPQEPDTPGRSGVNLAEDYATRLEKVQTTLATAGVDWPELTPALQAAAEANQILAGFTETTKNAEELSALESAESDVRDRYEQ